jgi:hypothetical protein
MFTQFNQRTVYYIGWSLTDLASNLSGFGFNGYDSKGEPKWDLSSNFDVRKVEVAVCSA